MLTSSVHWLRLGLDVTAKSLLLAAAAALVLRLLRVSDSQVRHRVWTGVLAGMLLLPLLSQIVPSLQLPVAISPDWLAIVDSPAEEASELRVGAATPVPAGAAQKIAVSEPPAGEFPADERSTIGATPPASSAEWNDRTHGGAVWNVTSGGRSDEVRPAAKTAEMPSKFPAVGQAVLEDPRSTGTLLRRWPIGLFCLWLIGTSLMLARLLFGFLTMTQLVKASTPVTTGDLAELGLDPRCWLSGSRPPALLECPHVRVPITLGLFRTAVLLPPEWLEWSPEKLEAVLLHERTHVERRDSAIAFLAELNVALNWLNPLSWWLRRRLAELAEEACDDTAIEWTGDRTSYARHLLEVAASVSTTRGRLIPASVSMARLCQVESRINSILDLTRPLSQRPSWKTTLIILLGLGPMIAIAAALRPGAADRQDPPVAATTERGGANPLAAAGNDVSAPSGERQKALRELPGDLFQYAGTVVDEEGKPVAGARVALNFWRMMGDVAKTTQAVSTDAEGRFEMNCRRSDFDEALDDKPWMYAQFVATKPGHGFAAGGSVLFETTGRLDQEIPADAREYFEREKRKAGRTLKLVGDLPIRGRILDTEGRPVAGAVVEPFNADEGESGSLEAWEAATKKPGANFYSVRGGLVRLFGGDFGDSPKDPAFAVRTDADGWFTLTGIGRERLVSVVLSGPNIESSILRLRSRAGETIRIPDDDRGDEGRNFTYYPAEFTHIAGPSQPIEGVVTDRVTGKPIAGLLVRGERTATSPVGGSAGFIRSTTDREGRYRLNGFPLGTNQFVILPTAQAGYLAAGVETETKAGAAGPRVTNVSLTSSLTARGVITEVDSGQPVHGYVEYFALAGNPALKETKNFQHVDQRLLFRTDVEGRFEIPVLPGPGIITFSATYHERYPRGEGADKIQAPTAMPRPDDVKTYSAQPYMVTTVNYHGLIPVEPAADAKSIDVALQLHRLQSIAGRVVARDGSPVDEYALYGENAPASWYDHSGKAFEVKGYQPRYGRRLMAYDRRTDSIGRLDLTGEVSAAAEIRLQPAARIVGRVVDGDGQPLAGLHIDNDPPSQLAGAAMSYEDSWSGAFDPQRAEFLEVSGYPIVTDGEGRFELLGAMPGLKYSARVRGTTKLNGQSYPTILGSIFTDVVAQPGEKRDVGDVRIQEPKPAQASPAPKGEKNATQSVKTPAQPAPSGTDPSNNPTLSRLPRYTGSVVEASGQPIAKAQLWIVLSVGGEEGGTPISAGATDAQGQFSFEPTAEQQERLIRPGAFPCVVAQAAGFGIDGLPLQLFEIEPVENEDRRRAIAQVDGTRGSGHSAKRTVTLPPAVPLEGRLVDLEGKPLAGVRVVAHRLVHPALDRLLEGLEKGSDADVESAANTNSFWMNRPLLERFVPPVMTGADGRFTMSGLGRDQVATIFFEGERVESQQIRAVLREMPTRSVPHLSTVPEGARDVYVGQRFSHALGPAIPVTGVVKDFRSGEPIPGATVFVERLFEDGSTTGGHLRLDVDQIRTTTDAQGRYRLTGIPPGAGHVLNAVAPTTEPWLIAAREFSLATDQPQATVDVAVYKGIWLEGRVSDQTTGEPISGYVDYLALQKNPNTPQKAGLQEGWQLHRFPIDAGGRYRVPGLPGEGVLLVSSFGKTKYPRAVGAAEIEGYEAESSYIPTTPIGLPLSNWSLIKAVHPAADAKSFECDLPLSAGKSVPGRVVGAEGEPVADFESLGLIVRDPFWHSEAKGKFAVSGYDDVGPRQLFFKNVSGTRVGKFLLRGPAPAEISVTLEPAVRVTGILIETETGEPAAGYSLYCRRSSMGTYRIPDVTADEQGRFGISALLAGETYEIDAANTKRFNNEKNGFQIDLREARPGAVIDLGEVTGKNAKLKMARPAQVPEMKAHASPGEGAEKSTNGAAALTEKPRDSAPKTPPSVVATGQVRQPDGQPAADVLVAIIAHPNGVLRGGDQRNGHRVVAETRTDREGRFRLAPPDVTETSHGGIGVVAGAAGWGTTGASLDSVSAGQDLVLTLQSEHELRGRLLDIEGRPAAGVPLRIEQIVDFPNRGRYFGVTEDSAKELSAWPPTVVTDSEGRFALRQVGPGCGVMLEIDGSDRFAPHTLAINAGIREERGSDDATYRPQSKNPGPDGVAEFVLAPAQIFEGTVRYADTKQPAPHSRISIWASQQTPAGSMVSVTGQADAAGRYRIHPRPGVRFGIIAYPSAGEPYLAKRSEEIPWNGGVAPMSVDLELPRGVLVRGTIIHRETRRPEPEASIQYIPRRATVANFRDQIITGWQGIVRSGADGTFSVSVPPGAGTLLIHGAEGEFVLQEIGERQLSLGLSGGTRHYAHAILPIDPKIDQALEPLNVELQPAVSLTGALVDEAGRPIPKAKLISRLCISHISPTWREFTWEAKQGRFQMRGLTPGKEETIHFLDEEQKLGATVTLAPTDDGRTVTLTKCGEATARFVTADGTPVPDFQPLLTFVMTPGSMRQDLKAYQAGITPADEVWAVNLDHKNYRPMPKTAADGSVTFPALVPGARYRLDIFGEEGPVAKGEFVAESGKTIDLGPIVIKAPKP